MAWIRKKIKIRSDYTKEQREVIGQEIVDFIVKRSKQGRDKNNDRFPGYSKSYTNSKDFKIAGKSKGNVNLTLSDEMLNSLKVLSTRKGEITIGYDRNDNRNNAVAEGNIKGTYGQKTPIRGKKRDFLGIKKSDITGEIYPKYPLNNKRKLTDAVTKFLTAQQAAEDELG